MLVFEHIIKSVSIRKLYTNADAQSLTCHPQNAYLNAKFAEMEI